MGIIIIAPFAVLAGWSIFAIYRWLQRSASNQTWRKSFFISTGAGIFIGIWATFFFQYNVANKRLQGFPIPSEILSREQPTDPWVKSSMPPSIQIGVMVTDLLCCVALSLVPIAAAAFIKANRIQHGASADPHPHNPI